MSPVSAFQRRVETGDFFQSVYPWEKLEQKTRKEKHKKEKTEKMVKKFVKVSKLKERFIAIIFQKHLAYAV